MYSYPFSAFPEHAVVKTGDCTFEENMCIWNNAQPNLYWDEFDWVRFPYGIESGTHYTKQGSFINNSTEAAFYLTLNGDMLRPDRAGLSALIYSIPFEPNVLQCMSFHYFMYQTMAVDQKRPSLGGLRVYIKPTTSRSMSDAILIWRLNNHQSNKWRVARVPLGEMIGFTRVALSQPYEVMFEGIWANSKRGLIAIDDISFVYGDCASK